MKILYIESKQKNLEINLSKEQISKLPKNLFLAYSIQYKSLAFLIKKQLEKNKIKIIKTQQILGCSKINTKLPILLIGSGEFHAMNLYLQAPIIYRLENTKIIRVPEKEIEDIRIKRKTALLKFLSADKIGILVSTKPGQENLQKAIKLKQILLNKNKQAHIFISNNIDISQFENFHIDSGVNTACPGLSFDNPEIIDYSEILEIK